MELKNNFKILLFFLLPMFIGCGMQNPESYGRKWENTFVFFNPNDTDTLLVGGCAIPDECQPLANGNDFRIEWKKKSGKYSVSLGGEVFPADIVYFSGYDATDIEEEQPWQYQSGKHILTVRKLSTIPENGYYFLMISRKP